MPTHPDSDTQSAAPLPAFVQVLYVGRFRSPELIATLRRDGVGVVAAFDSQRGAELLQHFRPDAILCGNADVDAVLAYAAPDIPVILVADERPRRSDAPTTPSRGVVDDDALADQIRRKIAANREMAQDSDSDHSDQRPPRRE